MSDFLTFNTYLNITSFIGNIAVIFILYAGSRELLGWFCDQIRDLSYNRQLPTFKFGKKLIVPVRWSKGSMKIWGVNLGMFVFGVVQYLNEKDPYSC